MTPAVTALEAAGEAFRLDPMQVFKTLVAATDDELLCAVVAVGTRLDLRKLARHAGAKRATMAHTAAAERRTGYVLGGISPFGQRTRHRTFVDETATLFDEVYASAGRRGLEVVVAPSAFETVLDAVFADIATQ